MFFMYLCRVNISPLGTLTALHQTTPPATLAPVFSRYTLVYRLTLECYAAPRLHPFAINAVLPSAPPP